MTTGITETTFAAPFQDVFVFDVGGMRSERQKWIHCFENVGAILFTVDITSYDQILFEDPTVNRIHEALELFHSIVNTRWFVNTTIALLFTKCDKLATKLKSSPLENYFPDFYGGDDLEAATTYMTNRFVSLKQYRSQSIEVHYINIVDDPRGPGKTAMDFLERVTHDASARVQAGRGTEPRGVHSSRQAFQPQSPSFTSPTNVQISKDARAPSSMLSETRHATSNGLPNSAHMPSEKELDLRSTTVTTTLPSFTFDLVS